MCSSLEKEVIKNGLVVKRRVENNRTQNIYSRLFLASDDSLRLKKGPPAVRRTGGRGDYQKQKIQ
jgi:hypothetical protein